MLDLLLGEVRMCIIYGFGAAQCILRNEVCASPNQVESQVAKLFPILPAPSLGYIFKPGRLLLSCYFCSQPL